MRKEILAVCLIALIALSAIPSMAALEQKIVISDPDNRVKYQKFEPGDPWNITVRNTTTNEIVYQFSGTIGMDSTNLAGNNWFVYFSCVSPGALNNGVLRFLVPGTYEVYANGTNNGQLIEETGTITVLREDDEDNQDCGRPTRPMPEINPIILTSAGIMGLLLISRKYRRN